MKKEYVWRYMSLAKYIDLLATRAVFLPKAALLNDETEGKWIAHALLAGEKRRWAKAKGNADRLRAILEVANGDPDQILCHAAALYENLAASEKNSVLLEVLRDLPRAYREKRAEYLETFIQSWTRHHDGYNTRVQQWLTDVAIHRESTYVSCWNRADSMSLAMWNLYGGGHESVAIRSTVQKLESLVQSNVQWLEERSLCGSMCPVHYQAGLKDPDDALIGELLERLGAAKDTSIGQFSIKPDLYAYEQEVRILLYPVRRLTEPLRDPHPTVDGFALPVPSREHSQHPLSELIDAVHIHPMLDSRSMMHRGVRTLHDRLGFSGLPVITDRIEAIGSDMCLEPSLARSAPQ